MDIERVDERLEGKKRQRLPYVLKWDCPECGKQRETDLTEKYLSCPVWGNDALVPLFCMECDEFEPVTTATITPDIDVDVE